MDADYQSVLDRLEGHRMLGTVPLQEREWVARHGELRRHTKGEVINSPALGSVPGMLIILSWHLGIYVYRGNGPQRVLAWGAGEVTGRLPYSRMKAPPGNTIAEEDSDVLFIPTEQLQELTSECHEFTSHLVHVMLDRAREFNTNDAQNERMASLGKLAAGLSHELNNPASAIARSAKLLGDRLSAVESTSRELGEARLSAEQFARLEALRELVTAPLDRVRSPIEEAHHENEISEWLDHHGARQTCSDALAGSAITIAALDELAMLIDPKHLDAALCWIAEGSSVRRMAKEIEQAGMRISDLVTQVKKFSRMDQAAVAEPVSLSEGLTATLAMVRSKAQSKSVSVSVSVDPQLPSVRGFAGELNQIWVNLIDNAIDAAGESGHVDVTATHESGSVVVRVIDNGPGIPVQLRERIFEAFFTTKPVGSGLGLGLDVVRRLVRHNEGVIKVLSNPGRTEFQVTLPLVDTRSDGVAR
jgi:signal transduction histidine kinase